MAEISFKEIEKHVLDDAVAIVATLGMTTPLLDPMAVHKFGEGKHEAAAFLRATLSRHVILVAARLHAEKGFGQTGATASIDSYIYYAERDGVLLSTQADEFRSGRQRMIAKLEQNGIPFSHLVTFRNSELAHSILRKRPFDNRLMSLPIWDFAYETYELVLAIEGVVSGAAKLDLRFHEWQTRGVAFWDIENEIGDLILGGGVT